MNAGLYAWMKAKYLRGGIVLIGCDDVIGLAIREGQRTITKDKKPSLWSHSFLFADIRTDCSGPNRAKTSAPFIFESDIEVSPWKPEVKNGAQENWAGKWAKNSVQHAALFEVPGAPIDAVLAEALQLTTDQATYPLLELIGTWVAIVIHRQWQKNPLDDPRAMYCSAFVRHCYKTANADFLGGNVSLSNTAPEHIAQALHATAEWHRT